MRCCRGNIYNALPDIDSSYKLNIKFWDDAWQRVKNPYRKLADLDYIPDIPRVFKEHNVSSVLDIACGSGWLAFYLAEHGFKPVGVDISAAAIALANRWIVEDSKNDPDGSILRTKPRVQDEAVCTTTSRGTEVRATDAAKFYVADMMNLAPCAKHFPSDGFDGLLVNAAFEHLDYSRGAEFLKHVAQYIKASGIMFAIFDKVGEGGKGEYIELEDGTKQYTDKFRDGMFLRYYSDVELRNLLKESGWQVMDWRENAAGSRIVVARNDKVATPRNNVMAKAKVEIDENTQFIINLHTMLAIAFSAALYFYDPVLAKGALIASAVLNLYLRVLCYTFAEPLNPQDNPIIIMLVSGFRGAITGALLYLAIIKFKISVMMVLVAVLIYLLVLLISGFRRR